MADTQDPYSLCADGLRLEPIGYEHAEGFLKAVEASARGIQRWLSPDFAPRTHQDVTAFIETWSERWRCGTAYGLVVRVEDGGRIVGFGLLNQINFAHRFANLGYWIRPEMSGRGYASTTTKLLVRFAFSTLGLVRLELVIEPENAASQRVAEKAGAVYEGYLQSRLVVDGDIKDALMYSIVRDGLKRIV